MTSMLTLILVVATLAAGTSWCVGKFFFVPRWRECQAAVQAAAGDSLDEATLKEITLEPS